MWCKSNLKRKRFLLLFACLTIILVSIPEWGWGQESAGLNLGGKQDGSVPLAGPLQFFRAFTLRGGYVAAGVGMRNLGFGGININVPGRVVSAFLYWDILNPVELQSFRTGFLNGVQIFGTPIGNDVDPCWGASRNWAYRADVTRLIRPGQFCYRLTGFASGVTDGRQPVVGVNPLAEGASLVVVFRNNANPLTTVVMYDGSSTTGPGPGGGPLLTTTLGNFMASNPVGSAQTTWIVADGQNNGGKRDTFQACNGAVLTRINALDGLDPNRNPDCSPRPDYGIRNLWDTQTVNVTNRVPPGCNSVTATLTGSTDGGRPADCIVWIAQVFSVTAPDCYSRFPAGDDTFQVSSATLGVDLNCSGTVDFNLSANGPFNVHRGAPVRPPDNRCEIPTQITSLLMTASGGDAGNFTIWNNPDLPSTGLIKQQTAGIDFPADSFFDVFVKIQNDTLGTAFNCDPIRLATTINAIPPLLNVYGGVGSVPFFSPDDPCGTPVFCLTHVGHRPERPACPPASGSCVGLNGFETYDEDAVEIVTPEMLLEGNK